MATNNRPAQVFQAITCRVTPTRFQPPEIVAHSPNPVSTSWALSDALAPRTTSSSDCFPGEHQRGAGADATRLAGRPVMPSNLRHGVQPAVARLEPATATAMAGHFPCSKASSRGRRWGDANSKGGAPRPLRGADGRAVLRSACASFLLQEFHARPLGFPPPQLAACLVIVARRNRAQALGIPRNSRPVSNPDILVDQPGRDLHNAWPRRSAGGPTGAVSHRRARSGPIRVR